MITSSDILKRTGLKSAKTLTRWHQMGLIPEPLVRTHPSGRGKVAYWPDWVLDRCLKIVELRREGHSLKSAAKVLGVERLRRLLEPLDDLQSASKILAETRVKLSPDREGTLLDAFHLAMMASVESKLSDVSDQRRLLDQLKESDAVIHAWKLLRAGYAPVLFYDGERAEIIPDFLVSWRLTADLPPATAFIIAPLLPTFRRVFPNLKSLAGMTSPVLPAPKIWVQQGDAVVEYTVYLAGPAGFEVIEETAKVVSTVGHETTSNDDAI